MMEYINAYPKFGFVGIFLRLIYAFFHISLIGIFSFLAFQIVTGGLPIIILVLAFLFLVFFLSLINYLVQPDMWLTSKVNISVSDEGLVDKRIFRKIKFSWNEIQFVKTVSKGFYRNQFLAVEMDNRTYVFHPFLIDIDNNQNKTLKFRFNASHDYKDYGFGYTFYEWQLADGSRKVIKLNESTAYDLLKKYRPDLVENIKLAPEPFIAKIYAAMGEE